MVYAYFCPSFSAAYCLWNECLSHLYMKVSRLQRDELWPAVLLPTQLTYERSDIANCRIMVAVSTRRTQTVCKRIRAIVCVTLVRLQEDLQQKNTPPNFVYITVTAMLHIVSNYSAITDTLYRLNESCKKSKSFQWAHWKNFGGWKLQNPDQCCQLIINWSCNF